MLILQMMLYCLSLIDAQRKQDSNPHKFESLENDHHTRAHTGPSIEMQHASIHLNAGFMQNDNRVESVRHSSHRFKEACLFCDPVWLSHACAGYLKQLAG